MKQQHKQVEANARATRQYVATDENRQEQLPLANRTSPAIVTMWSGDRSSTLNAQPLNCYNLLFPRKVQRILSDAEKHAGEGWDKIISWVPDGKGFKIHNTKKFAAEIMPTYFGSSKFRTFQRSLNLWGFKTPLSGPDRGVSSHPMFQRDAPDLCENMKRLVIKSKKQQSRPIEGTKSQSKPPQEGHGEELILPTVSVSSTSPSPASSSPRQPLVELDKNELNNLPSLNLPITEDAARKVLRDLLIEQAARLLVGVSTIENLLTRSSTSASPPAPQDYQQRHGHAAGYCFYY